MNVNNNYEFNEISVHQKSSVIENLIESQRFRQMNIQYRLCLSQRLQRIANNMKIMGINRKVEENGVIVMSGDEEE